MGDAYLDSLREQAFSIIGELDYEIQPVVEQLAQLIAKLPDTASMAPTKKHYLVQLLSRIDDIHRQADPNSTGYEDTLMDLGFILVARLDPAVGNWQEQL